MINSAQNLIEKLKNNQKGSDFKTFFSKFATRAAYKIKKRTIIFNQNDLLERLYYVRDGFVKYYQLSEDGRETTSYLMGPGQLLGLRALISKDESSHNTAEALTDITVITMSHKECFENFSTHPEYLVDLIHVLVDRLNYTEQKVEGFMFTDSTARVAYFIADCADRFGKKTGKHIVLPLKLTHQLIAGFVGSFRETVTLSMNQLVHEGVIAVDHGIITISGREKLGKYARPFSSRQAVSDITRLR